ESDPGGLSSGEAAQPSVEVIEFEVQSEIGGGGQCAFFDVPVIADAVEVGVIGVTVQRALQGVTDIGDAEGRIDALRRMRQELIDVDGTVGAGGGSGSGGQESGEDLRECGFADPVVPDQADEAGGDRSEEHTSELQSRFDLVCRLLL